MNLPNKLTLFRVLLIPVFLFLYFSENIPYNYFWSLIVFAGASFTDMLDGQIARKYNLVTDFGKLMDPLADKLLVMSALVCLLQGSQIMIICLIIVLSRDLIVTSVRLVAASKNIIIAADIWGKLKTITQMVWICLALVDRSFIYHFTAPVNVQVILAYAVQILFTAMMSLTIISGFNYCWQNKQLFLDN